MPESKDRPTDDFEAEDAAELPERHAMSLLNPTSLFGGTTIMPVLPTQETPAAPPPDGAAAPGSPPGIATPHLPPGVSTLPPTHPGDTYQPDATDTATS